MKYSTKLLLSFFGLAVAACTLLFFLVNHLAERSLFRQIQKTARAIAITTAHEIDGDLHDRIRGDAPEQSASYRDLVSQLRAIRDSLRTENIDIAFIYTFRPSDVNPSEWIYVADAEEEPAQRSSFGDPFEFKAQNRADLVFELDRPAKADSGFTSDQYGTFLSADAPVRDSSGNIVARVGIDFNASDVHAVQGRLRTRSILALFAASSLGILLSLILSKWTNQPLSKITAALEDIGAGKLDTRLNSTRTDEFGLVERAVDGMASALESRTALEGALTRYVARDMAKDFAGIPGESEHETGSVRKRITVLFCDIEGFDSASGEGSAESILNTLNDFFSQVVKVIFESGGTLDRFNGAGLMATFGTVRKDTAHEQLAISTAIKMQQAFASVVTCEGVALRIGIHTGEASVGDHESQPQMAYEAIGEAVNGAARIAVASRERGIAILASADTLTATAEQFRAEKVEALAGEEPCLQLFSIAVS